jgi:hypothetical protein
VFLDPLLKRLLKGRSLASLFWELLFDELLEDEIKVPCMSPIWDKNIWRSWVPLYLFIIVLYLVVSAYPVGASWQNNMIMRSSSTYSKRRWSDDLFHADKTVAWVEWVQSQWKIPCMGAVELQAEPQGDTGGGYIWTMLWIGSIGTRGVSSPHSRNCFCSPLWYN